MRVHLTIAVPLSALLILSASGVAEDEQEAAVKDSSAGADFVHHSHIEKLPDRRYSLVRWIRNNHDTSPLSAEWKSAGLFAVGDHQICPGCTQNGKQGDSTNYRQPIDSTIKYGVQLQYPAAAKVHVHEPTDGEKLVSSLGLTLPNGETKYLITVTSTLDKELGTATLDIKSTGALTLLLPQRLGPFMPSSTPSPSEGWSARSEKSLRSVVRGDKTVVSSVSQWFGADAEKPVFQLRKAEHTDSFVGTFKAPHWTIERISVVAMEPEKTGAVGMHSYVYVPVSD